MHNIHTEKMTIVSTDTNKIVNIMLHQALPLINRLRYTVFSCPTGNRYMLRSGSVDCECLCIYKSIHQWRSQDVSSCINTIPLPHTNPLLELDTPPQYILGLVELSALLVRPGQREPRF